MNTIDDLKATLAADASSVDGVPHTARAAGVDGKIRAIRRQRRAGAVAGVAALAAIVGFGVLPALSDDPRAPQDEELEVAGHVVPREIEILDFPFRFVASAESQRGDATLELELDDSDRRRAVAVAVDDLPAGATVTLAEDGALLARVVGPSKLDDPLPVGRDEGTLTLTVSGGSEETRVGLATYERTGELAPGLTDPGGTVVFRDHVADRSLVGGAWVDPATGEASFTVRGRLDEIRVSDYCDSNGARVFYVVAIDDGVFQSGRCDDLGTFDEDPAGGGWASSGASTHGVHHVRMWTTDRQFSEKVVPFPGVLAGSAAYDARPGRPVLGEEIPELTEWDGRLFELEAVDGRTHHLEADGPRLVGFVLGSKDGTWLRIQPEKGPVREGTGLDGDNGGSSLDTLLWPGQAYDLSLVDLRGEPVDGALLIYRPVD